MDDFRGLGQLFLDKAEELCRDLMFDVLPDVDLAKVRDDLTNMNRGFSFVQHQANQLSNAYLDLSARACTTRRNGLLKDGCWNWNAIYLYMKKKEALLEALAGVLYTTGGQMPRASELFSLECQNGATRARGIYVYDGFVVYLTRHHKAKRSTNREFYVVRFLPLRPGRIVYYYLAYIRPFTEMLQREDTVRVALRGAPPPKSTFLFYSDQDPDKPWESRRLTAVLRKASSRTWGWPVNTQLCRQLTVAITEKHVKEVYRRFNWHDDKGPGADLNVAFAWQSGHRPLQRAITYGLDGAFPTHLQPGLLRVYEWASTRWHEFLHQPSKVMPLTQRASAVAPRQQSPPLSMSTDRQSQNEFQGEDELLSSVSPESHQDPTKKRKQPGADASATHKRITAPNVGQQVAPDDEPSRPTKRRALVRVQQPPGSQAPVTESQCTVTECLEIQDCSERPELPRRTSLSATMRESQPTTSMLSRFPPDYGNVGPCVPHFIPTPCLGFPRFLKCPVRLRRVARYSTIFHNASSDVGLSLTASSRLLILGHVRSEPPGFA